MTNTKLSLSTPAPRTSRSLTILVAAVLAIVAVVAFSRISYNSQIVPVDADTTAESTWDCLRDAGLVGRSDDGAERLYPTRMQLGTCGG